jgi:hypothetical protein
MHVYAQVRHAENTNLHPSETTRVRPCVRKRGHALEHTCTGTYNYMLA